jgi:hypothetical protein
VQHKIQGGKKVSVVVWWEIRGRRNIERQCRGMNREDRSGGSKVRRKRREGSSNNSREILEG